MPNVRRSNLKIVYEDNHLLVINKDPGILVQGDKTGDETLTDLGREYLKAKYQKPGNVFLHCTHRLDRPVSGLVVFARTSKSLDRMNKAFREREVEKTYLAIVKGIVKKTNGNLRHWIEKDKTRNIARIYKAPQHSAKEALLDYELISRTNSLSLLSVHPLTGRPHQIRAQMSKIDHPIKGDLKYGFPTANHDKSISLHAFKLTFIHPVKKEPIELLAHPDGEAWKDFNKVIHELD